MAHTPYSSTSESHRQTLSEQRTAAAPHSTTRTFRWGASPENATHAIILLHGRGGMPQQIANNFCSTLLTQTTESKLCVIALAAEDRKWYPFPFSRGVAANEPYMSAAVDRVEREVRQLEAAGITRENIIVGGFSQGACLTAKFAFTYPARYGGLFVLSGALPGLLSFVTNSVRGGIQEYEGVDLQGTRVLVGCGDADSGVPVQGADWTAWAFEKVGASVDKRIYPGVGHMVCQEEKDVIKGWVDEMMTQG